MAAIDRRVDRVDGAPEVHRYRPRAPQRFRSGGPLRAVSAHRLSSPDHWHLVTYGLSELDSKESDDPGVSGWGFELTMRVAKGTGATGGRGAGGAGGGVAGRGAGGPGDEAGGVDEPAWAVDLLTNLAAYVWTSGHGFAAGDHIDLRGPVGPEKGGELSAAAVVVDPALGRMKGPFGRVSFLQVVVLTADELELCRSLSTDDVVAALAATDPLLVTRTGRRSLLSDPVIGAELAARAGADRRALTELAVATLSWRRRLNATVVKMGAGASAALGPALRRGLTSPGATFTVLGDAGAVRFRVADAPAWQAGAGRIDVAVPLSEVDELAGLFDGRVGWGRRPAWPGLRWQVVR